MIKQPLIDHVMLEPLVNVLHDMASPMNTLELSLSHLQSQLIEEPETNLKSNDVLVQLRRSQQTVARLETLLLRARQQLRLVGSTTIDLSSQLGMLLDQFQPQSRLRKIDMSIDCQAGLRMNGSPLLFEQMVTNLIQNSLDAYGFDPPRKPQRREVTVSAYKIASFIQITICDWAGGFSQKAVKAAFQKHVTTKVNGNGFGLVNVKQIVEGEFAGSVSLRNQKSIGTRITLLCRI